MKGTPQVEGSGISNNDEDKVVIAVDHSPSVLDVFKIDLTLLLFLILQKKRVSNS